MSETGTNVFYGTKKSPYQQHKLGLGTARRFAALIDPEAEKGVLRWLKRATGQFAIKYRAGKAYEPDFVVETTSEKLWGE